MDEISQAKSLGKVFGIINKYVGTTFELYDYLAEQRRERTLRRVK
jgi:hypothetical protein